LAVAITETIQTTDLILARDPCSSSSDHDNRSGNSPYLPVARARESVEWGGGQNIGFSHMSLIAQRNQLVKGIS
jgi:hypothetical protein